MSMSHGKGSMRAAGDEPWYHNPLAFFGLTFLAVLLGGYLACLAAGFTIYQITKAPLEQKLDELRRR